MKTGCYGGVQQAQTLWNQLKTLISICKRPEFFPAKQESQEKTSNLTEQLIEVSVLIRIVLDSFRDTINMLRSAVMRLHFWILEVLNFKQNSL